MSAVLNTAYTAFPLRAYTVTPVKGGRPRRSVSTCSVAPRRLGSFRFAWRRHAVQTSQPRLSRTVFFSSNIYDTGRARPTSPVKGSCDEVWIMVARKCRRRRRRRVASRRRRQPERRYYSHQRQSGEGAEWTASRSSYNRLLAPARPTLRILRCGGGFPVRVNSRRRCVVFVDGACARVRASQRTG